MSSSGTNPKISIDVDREDSQAKPKGKPAVEPAHSAQPTTKLQHQTWNPPQGSSDTVKLNHQRWTPPKEAPDTVKLNHQTWQPPPAPTPTQTPATPATPEPVATAEEDKDTDIRDVPLPGVARSIVSSQGESDAQAVGEIGYTEEEPVRIVSVPPPANLPGVTERTPVPGALPPGPPKQPSPPMQTNRTPAVPIPKPAVAGQPVVRRDATPMPHAVHPTPAPLRDESAPFERQPLAHVFRDDSTPFPTQRPAKQRHDETMMINIGRGPTRLVIVTAIAASLLGLGAGYMLWGFPNRGAAEDTETQVPTESTAAPSPVVTAPAEAETCVLKVKSTPSKATVSVDGTDVGVTPLTRELPCEEATVEVSRNRFAASTQKVELKADESLEVRLKRPRFELKVVSKPAGAAVTIDGKKVGKTPLTAKVRGHVTTRVKLTRAGFRALTAKVNAKKDGEVTYVLKKRRRRR